MRVCASATDTGDSSDARSIAWQKALSALDAIPILVGARSFYWTWETFIRLKLWIGLADKSRHGGTFLVALVLGRILLSDAVRAAKPFAREAILSLLEQWFMYCIDKTNAVQSSSTPASRSADKPASSLSFSSNGIKHYNSILLLICVIFKSPHFANPA